MEQELQKELKKIQWWEEARTQALVSRTRAGELEGLRELMMLIGSNKTKYKLEDGTRFDTTVWVREHLWAFHASNKTEDGLLIIQQSSALVGDQDLLLEVQGQLGSGTSQFIGNRTVTVEDDSEILGIVLGKWDQQSFAARDHEVLLEEARRPQGKGEPSVLTRKWLNMSSEDRAEYMMKRHSEKEES